MNSSTGEQPYTVVVGADGSPTGQAALRWANRAGAGASWSGAGDPRVWMSPYDWQIEVLNPVDEKALRAAAQQRLHDALGGVDVGGAAVEASSSRVSLDGCCWTLRATPICWWSDRGAWSSCRGAVGVRQLVLCATRDGPGGRGPRGR